MIKSALCAAGALFVSAAPVLADNLYLNPEWNGGWSGSDFGGGVLDAHVGYESGAFYIQGGPSVLMPDGDVIRNLGSGPLTTCLFVITYLSSMTNPLPVLLSFFSITIEGSDCAAKSSIS